MQRIGAVSYLVRCAGSGVSRRAGLSTNAELQSFIGRRMFFCVER